MTMRHERALQLAATAVDWPLSSDETDELDRHLRDCAACRSAAAGMRQQAVLLETRPRTNVPSGMADRISVTWQPQPMTAGFDGALRLVLLVLLLALIVAMVAVGAGAFPPDRLTPVQAVVPSLPAPQTRTVPNGPAGSLPTIGSPMTFHIALGAVTEDCTLLAETGCATDAMLAFASFWTTSRHGVERVDPVTGQSRATIPVGGDPIRMIATDDAVWVTSSDGTLSRIDPTDDKVTGSVDIGRLPAGLAWFAGAVWVADGESKAIVRVDPVAMQVHGSVTLDVAPWSVAATSGAVWASDRYAQRLFRIDSGSMTARSFDVPGAIPMSSWDYGDGVMTQGDRVWVASGEAVARFDPATETFTSTTTPVFPHLAMTGDAIWLLSRDSRVLQRLDRDTLEVVAQQQLGLSLPDASADWEVSIAADGDQIWLQSYMDGMMRITVDDPPRSAAP